MREGEPKKEPGLSINEAELGVPEVVSRRDTSPKRVMHGEVNVTEEVDVKLSIGGENYEATLFLSDYQDEAPPEYEVKLQPTLVKLRNADGEDVELSNSAKQLLMRKITSVAEEAK